MRLEDGIWKQAALINSLKLICSLEMDQFNDLTSVMAYFAAVSQFVPALLGSPEEMLGLPEDTEPRCY